MRFRRKKEYPYLCYIIYIYIYIPTLSPEVDFFSVLLSLLSVSVLSDAEGIIVDKVSGSITVVSTDGSNVEVEIVLTKQNNKKKNL